MHCLSPMFSVQHWNTLFTQNKFARTPDSLDINSIFTVHRSQHELQRGRVPGKLPCYQLSERSPGSNLRGKKNQRRFRRWEGYHFPLKYHLPPLMHTWYKYKNTNTKNKELPWCPFPDTNSRAQISRTQIQEQILKCHPPLSLPDPTSLIAALQTKQR